MYKRYLSCLIEKMEWVKSVDVKEICNIIKNSEMVITAGNGGSSGNASHMACEIQKGCNIPTICLNESIQLLTAWSNDLSYDEALMRQYRVISKGIKIPHTLILYSGSGNSKNIINLAEEAIKNGAHVIGMTGYSSNRLDILCNTSLCLNIDKDDSVGIQVAEDIHAILNHMIFLELIGSD